MFKKGDKVTVYGVWNQQTGSYTFRQGEVYSCGKKQMVINAVGNPAECLGRNFKPSEEQYGTEFVLPAVSDAEARAVAFKLSARYQERELQRYARILSLTTEAPGSAYVRHIERDRDILAASMPAAMSRAEADAVVQANIAGRIGHRYPRYA